MIATYVRIPQLDDVPYPVTMEPNLVIEFTLANFKRDAQPSNKPDSDTAGLLFCLNSVKQRDLVTVHEASDGQEAHSPTVVFHRDDHVHTVRKVKLRRANCGRRCP